MTEWSVCVCVCVRAVPSNYVVVADMTQVSLVGLELGGSDRSVYTLVYGQSFNSFTGVALDSLRHVIYYTDVNTYDRYVDPCLSRLDDDPLTHIHHTHECSDVTESSRH